MFHRGVWSVIIVHTLTAAIKRYVISQMVTLDCAIAIVTLRNSETLGDRKPPPRQLIPENSYNCPYPQW